MLAQEATLSIPFSERVTPASVPAIKVEAESRFGHARLIALLGGAQAIILVAGMVRLKLIALLLGPVGLGISGIIDLSAQLALQLGALHVPTAALRFLSIAQRERGAEGFAWLYRTFLRVVLGSSALVAAATAAVLFAWPASLGVRTGAYDAAVLFALAAVPLSAATNLIRNVVATLHRHRAAALALLASSALLVVSTFAGLRIAGLTGAYFASLVVALITVATLHALVRPTLKHAPASGSGSLVALLKAHPDIVRFSMTLYVVGFALPFSYWFVRWTVLGRLGEREAGFLTASFAIAAGLRAVFSQASVQYLIPLVSRDLAPGVRAAESAKYIRALLMLLLAGTLPLLLYPHELIIAFASRAFLPAITVMGLFILSEAIMSIGDAYRVLQLGLNDLMGYFLTTCGASVIIVAGAWWVVPRYGLLGAALLQVISALLTLAWSIERLWAGAKLRVERRSLAITAYVIVALTAAVFIGRAAPQPQLDWIAIKATIGLALLALGARLLPAVERRGIVRSLIPRPGST